MGFEISLFHPMEFLFGSFSLFRSNVPRERRAKRSPTPLCFSFFIILDSLRALSRFLLAPSACYLCRATVNSHRPSAGANNVPKQMEDVVRVWWLARRWWG